MRILLVLAHPLNESFAASVAKTAREALAEAGHAVDLLDLYAEDFEPRLTKAERGGYFDIPYDTSGVSKIVERLKAADGLILVFPQWWFNFPAILKGFFDRVFAPGVAFSHDTAGGRADRSAADKYQTALGSDDDGLAVVAGSSLHGRSGAPATEARHCEFLLQGPQFSNAQPARHGPRDRRQTPSSS